MLAPSWCNIGLWLHEKNAIQDPSSITPALPENGVWLANNRCAAANYDRCVRWMMMCTLLL
jgi:hypothetical protein